MKNLNWNDVLRRESGSLVMILCGVILVLRPDTASALIAALAGWAMIAVGVAALIGGFTGAMGGGSILSGAVLLLAGTWLHRNPLMIASVLGFVVGFVVLRQGIRAMGDAQRSKRCGGFWIPGAVLAVAELVIGVRLIFSPLTVSRFVLTLAGIAMAACGVWELISRRREKKYIPGTPNIIDADQ